MKKRSGFIPFLINSKTKREKRFRSVVATSFVWMFLGPSLATSFKNSDSLILKVMNASIFIAMAVFFVGFIMLAVIQIRRNNLERDNPSNM